MNFRNAEDAIVFAVLIQVGRDIEIAFRIRVDDEIWIVPVGVVKKSESQQANNGNAEDHKD